MHLILSSYFFRWGIVQHGMVSIVTMIYLGGHVASRNESILDCILILCQALCAVAVTTLIKLKCTIASDRGYGGTGGIINQTTIEKGCNILGTVKRIKSFPFTFGKSVASRSQTYVEEEGTFSASWCKKKVGDRRNGDEKMLYGLAYRTGMGKVVLAQTTIPWAGPGMWTYIPKREKLSRSDKPAINSSLRHFEENHISIITMRQRTPDWFLMRQFRITGSLVGKVLKVLSKDMSSTCNDENLERILKILSMEYSTDASHEVSN